VFICLERDADLHMAQLMPLPLTVSCYSKIQIGFTFLVPAHPGSPRKRAVKRVCVCVCVCVLALIACMGIITSLSVGETKYCVDRRSFFHRRCQKQSVHKHTETFFSPRINSVVSIPQKISNMGIISSVTNLTR